MSLRAYYKFEDNPGFLNDNSGNGKNLTGSGSQVNFIKGKGYYNTLNLYEAETTSLSINDNDSKTLMCFYKTEIGQPAANCYAPIIQIICPKTSWSLRYVNNGSSISLRANVYYYGVDINTNLSYNITFDPNKYYHIAAVFNKTNDIMYLYLNGNMIATTNIPTDTSSGSNVEKFVVLRNNSGGVIGVVDEIRVYNTALSSQEIKQIYSQLKGIF